MIKKIIIDKSNKNNDTGINYLLTNKLLPSEIELDKITILVGGNGIGKSTLINGIKKYNSKIDKATVLRLDTTTKKFFAYSYTNSTDSLLHYSGYEPACLHEKMSLHRLSEGEKLIRSLDFMLNVTVPTVHNDEKYKDYEVLVLLDEVDSGLSVDRCEYIGKKIKKMSKEYPFAQFIIASNNYEILKSTGGTAVSMYDGNKLKLKTYDEYKEYIKTNQKKAKIAKRLTRALGSIGDE